MRDQAKEVREAESGGPLEAGEADQRNPAKLDQRRGHETGQFRILKHDVPERPARTSASRRTGAVPPCLGHVQVMGPMPGRSPLPSPSAAQEFDVLRRPRRCRLASASQSMSARPAFRLLVCPSSTTARPGSTTEQEVEREGSRVGAGGVSVPGHLHQVAISLTRTRARTSASGAESRAPPAHPTRGRIAASFAGTQSSPDQTSAWSGAA